MKRSTVHMIKDWGLALALTIGVLVVWNLISGAPASGGEAPAFRLHSLEGEEVQLSDFVGQPVVLNFWATWCGPCRQEIPELSEFAAAHPEVVVLGISLDERLEGASLAAASRRLGIDYPVLHDASGEVGDAYGVSGLPTTFVVNGEGRIAGVRQGAIRRRTLETMTERAR